MSFRHLLISLSAAIAAVAALAAPVAAGAAGASGAVVYSKSSTSGDVVKGGLFAVKDGHVNQLTENPADVEPAFAPDGRTIVFVRDGDVFSIRPDGSGERRLSSGPEIDSAPLVSPSGWLVVFERRPALSGGSHLYTVTVDGAGVRALTSGAGDDSQADFAADGRSLVFVRATERPGGGSNDDLYSVRATGANLAPLTSTTRIDEFAPRFFAGGILCSRGESQEGPAAYADVYTMRRNGTKVKPLVAGVGSAYVEDVTPDGHTLLFRRDQGLWVKPIGPGKARRLSVLPDGSKTNSVFSSDGRRVAAFLSVEHTEQLMSIALKDGRKTELADSFESEAGNSIGPVIAWQP